MQVASGKKISIIGNALIDGKEQYSSFLIDDGRIARIEKGKVDFGAEVTITLPDTDVMFPGMINLHTHNDYNVFPLWVSPYKWSSRHQWRKNDDYVLRIKDFVNYIKSGYGKSPEVVGQLLMMSGIHFESLDSVPEAIVLDAMTEVFKVLSVVTEMQAVAGGTTTIEQIRDLESEEPDSRTFIIRNTGDPRDFRVGDRKIVSVVDFYSPDRRPTGRPDEDTNAWNPDRGDGIKNFVADLSLPTPMRYATLAHIAEGKSGNLLKTFDPYSRKEITTVIGEIGANKNLKSARLNFVHANGCDWRDKKTLSFLKENNIGIIWSPVSNLLLYGDTLPIDVLLNEGIRVALGSDWAPSGSKHLFDELKFARFYTSWRGVKIDDYDLFKLVAENPARMLGIENAVSELKPGAFADLFVIRKNTSASALTQLLDLPDTSIQFTMVNGRIVYGDESLFKTLNVDRDEIPNSEGPSVKQRRVSLNKAIGVDLATMLPKLDLVFYDYVNRKLEPTTVRSKMLASDDHPYLTRIEKLKNDLQAI